jgi:hypothetical protein
MTMEAMALAHEPENFVLKVDGRAFYCMCRCSVFRKVPDHPAGNVYQCNACGDLYIGEK